MAEKKLIRYDDVIDSLGGVDVRDPREKLILAHKLHDLDRWIDFDEAMWLVLTTPLKRAEDRVALSNMLKALPTKED